MKQRKRGKNGGTPPKDDIRLPFVMRRQLPDEEGSTRDFWAVEPSGNYIMDCATGAYYGRLTIAEMRRLGTGWLLQDIAWAMTRRADRHHKGLIIGFCAETERALLDGPWAVH